MKNEILQKKEEVELKKAEILEVSEKLKNTQPNDSETQNLNAEKAKFEKQLEEKNSRIGSLEFLVYRAIGKLHK